MGRQTTREKIKYEHLIKSTKQPNRTKNMEVILSNTKKNKLQDQFAGQEQVSKLQSNEIVMAQDTEQEAKMVESQRAFTQYDDTVVDIESQGQVENLSSQNKVKLYYDKDGWVCDQFPLYLPIAKGAKYIEKDQAVLDTVWDIRESYAWKVVDGEIMEVQYVFIEDTKIYINDYEVFGDIDNIVVEEQEILEEQDDTKEQEVIENQDNTDIEQRLFIQEISEEKE